MFGGGRFFCIRARSPEWRFQRTYTAQKPGTIVKSVKLKLNTINHLNGVCEETEKAPWVRVASGAQSRRVALLLFNPHPAKPARWNRRAPRFAPNSVDCNGLLAEREELTDEQWAIIAAPIPEPLLTAFYATNVKRGAVHLRTRRQS